LYRRTMATVQASRQGAKTRDGKTLILIAVFKLVKGLLLVGVGIGAFKLLHRDLADTFTHWVNILRVDPDNRFVHSLFSRVLRINSNQLRDLGVGTFVYAGLLLTEGTGLLLRKRWAEYFTIITTGLLIPVEVYELADHLTATKVAVLIVNIAIVVYLVLTVRRDASKHVDSRSTGSKM
jgi:uncharacterized membrane protein (DUF2068 family)